MKKPTQVERIITKLNRDGYVTRNEALKVFISRLASRILDLKKEGWEFDEGRDPNGKDYIYRVKRSPMKKIEYKLPDGKIIITYEK